MTLQISRNPLIAEFLVEFDSLGKRLAPSGPLRTLTSFLMYEALTGREDEIPLRDTKPFVIGVFPSGVTMTTVVVDLLPDSQLAFIGYKPDGVGGRSFPTTYLPDTIGANEVFLLTQEFDLEFGRSVVEFLEVERKAQRVTVLAVSVDERLAGQLEHADSNVNVVTARIVANVDVV